MSRDISAILAVYRLSVIELLRNKLGAILLVLVPCVFISIALATAGNSKIPIKLYLPDGTEQLLLTQHDIMLVFISASVNGFLTAYFSLLLFHRDIDYYRYSIFAGLSPTGFVVGRFSFFFTVAVLLAALTTILNGYYVSLAQPVSVFLGFLCLGVIYGSFGGIIGSLSKDFLVAFLGIFLLADLDAAWLQNPVYYSASQEQEFLRWLPAHFPTQLIFSSAFTDQANANAWHGIAAYLCLSFGGLFSLLCFRMRRISSVNRRPRETAEA